MHGRSDGVLNVRGIRIGTAEIYNALQNVPELIEAMAVEQDLPDTAAGGRIVLLVVIRPGSALTDDLVLRLRRRIAQSTAAVYVPGAIIDVAELPTTHSGKRSEAAARDALNGRPIRNSSALRNPECLAEISSHPRLLGIGKVPANAGTQEQLTTIWCNTFGLHSIGPDDNFFDLGGDSLLAMAICVAIEECLGYHVPIITLFQHPTLAKLAIALEGGGENQESPLVVIARPSVAGQRPIFLFHSVSGNIDSVRQVGVIRGVVGVSIGGLTPVEKTAVLDGADDGAAAVGDAVKPCAVGAPLRGCGA